MIFAGNQCLCRKWMIPSRKPMSFVGINEHVFGFFSGSQTSSHAIFLGDQAYQTAASTCLENQKFHLMIYNPVGNPPLSSTCLGNL